MTDTERGLPAAFHGGRQVARKPSLAGRPEVLDGAQTPADQVMA